MCLVLIQMLSAESARRYQQCFCCLLRSAYALLHEVDAKEEPGRALRQRIVHRKLRSGPRHIGQAYLSADAANRCASTGVWYPRCRWRLAIRSSRPVRLPGRVRCLGQGQVLADAPVEPEVLAIGDAGALLLAVVFLGQGQGDGRGPVRPGVPGRCALKLLRPKTQTDIVRGRHVDNANGGSSFSVLYFPTGA